MLRNQVAHPAGAYPTFHSMKQKKSITTLPWMGCQSMARLIPPPLQLFITFPWQFASTHLYSWVGGEGGERHCERKLFYPRKQRKWLGHVSVPKPDLTFLWHLWSCLSPSFFLVLISETADNLGAPLKVNMDNNTGKVSIFLVMRLIVFIATHITFLNWCNVTLQ